MLTRTFLTINTKVKGIEPEEDENMSYIWKGSPVNAIVRLLNPRSRNSKGQKTYLAPSGDTKLSSMTHSAQTTIPFYQH